MPDNPITQAGFKGKSLKRELTEPNTDHDKIVATEALVEVMRQHQVQQGIVMQKISDTMMQMRDDIDKRLDAMERIFNEHCKETDKDCGACRVELEQKISAGEEKNTIKLNDVIDKVDKILKRQEDKIDKTQERMTPKWVTTTFVSLVVAVFMVIGGTVWSNSIDIRDHMHGIKTVQQHIKDHEERMEDAHNQLHDRMKDFTNGYAEPVKE